METVGMVGLGAMGSALLERLRLAHVESVVYDISAEAMDCFSAALVWSLQWDCLGFTQISKVFSLCLWSRRCRRHWHYEAVVWLQL